MSTIQPEALRLAEWLQAAVATFPQRSEDEPGGYCSEVDQIMDEAAAELRSQHAELETLRAGYAAARLEIESPRAAQPAGAQQPGAAYAALPEPPQFPAHPEPMVMDWSAIEISAIAQYGRDMYEAGKRQSHGQPYPTIDDLCARIKAADDAAADRDYMLDSNDCIAVLRGEWKGTLAMDKPERASHGQAPAQAAPSYKDSTPDLHVVDSAFESWYSSYSPAHKADKQRARDAYAAGMGDPLVMVAPAAVAWPKKWAPEEVEDGERGIRWVTNEGIHGRPTDHDVREYLKRTPTANGCLCDECKVFYAAAPTTQPSPAAQGDALDAAFEAVRLLLCGLERYSFVLDDDGVVRRVRDRVGNWIEFDAAHELFDPAAVDAAIAAQQGAAT